MLKYSQGTTKTWDWGCHSVFEGDPFKPTEGFTHGQFSTTSAWKGSGSKLFKFM